MTSVRDRLASRFLGLLLRKPEARAFVLQQAAEAESTDEGALFDHVLKHVDDPELAKTFNESAAKDEAKLKEEQDRLEHDAAFLAARAADLETQAKKVAEQQQKLLLLIIAGLGLLVVFVGVAGIVFTHKVAGPIFKMKRLIRQIGEGKLVLREKLRKGDELQHFFEAFEIMVNDLRARQTAEISKVDKILERLVDAPVSQRGMREFDDDGVEMLKQLRREMQDQLEA